MEPTFVEYDLDDVRLTNEEHLKFEFRSEDSAEFSISDFQEKQFGIQQHEAGSVPSGASSSCGVNLVNRQYFANSDHSLRSWSGSSAGSDHASLTVSSNCSRDDTADKRELRPCEISTNTISALSHLPTWLWPNFPENVFKNFKVKAYIVKPDYFLCVSMTKPEEGEPKLEEFLTINHIFNFISDQPQFPQWKITESKIDKLLSAYVGMRKVPKRLYDRDSSAALDVKKFQYRLRALFRELPSHSLERSMPAKLVDFCNDLLYAIKTQHFNEKLSEDYILTLLEYFYQVTLLPLTIRQKQAVPLDLESTREPKGKKTEVFPDIIVNYLNSYFLIGEVKSHQDTSNKPKQRSGTNKQRRPSNDEAKEGDTEEHSCSGPVSKKMKVAHEEIPATSGDYQKERVPVSGVGCAGDAKTTDACKSKETECDKPSSSTSDKETKLDHFRYLKKEEEIKVQRYLPQLFSEMLAALDRRCHSDKTVHLGQNNERVQLGFCVEGFKLRFVRLVLRDVSSKIPPTVSMIRKPNVRCDLFLTKEFNLFNRRHLKMFFQMLLAFSYTYYI